MSWRLEGRTAVVTGASSGIGAATARLLADRGMTVVAVARRLDRLHEMAEATPGIMPYGADVTDTAQVDELAAWVARTRGACHALVNNAGVPGRSLEGRGDLDDVLRTLDVNLLGTVRCMASFADLLASSAPSRVVNVASVAGKLGIGPADYVASKFAVVGLSEALALSWAGRGVTVCQLNPGFVETEGFPQADVKRSPLAPLLAQPDVVAEAVVDALVRGRRERTVPRVYRAAVVLRHTVPAAWRAVAQRIERSSGRRG